MTFRFCRDEFWHPANCAVYLLEIFFDILSVGPRPSLVLWLENPKHSLPKPKNWGITILYIYNVTLCSCIISLFGLGSQMKCTYCHLLYLARIKSSLNCWKFTAMPVVTPTCSSCCCQIVMFYFLVAFNFLCWSPLLEWFWHFHCSLGNRRCDAAHQQKPAGAGATPDVAETVCSADPKCAGLYDEGCNGWCLDCDSGVWVPTLQLQSLQNPKSKCKVKGMKGMKGTVGYSFVGVWGKVLF